MNACLWQFGELSPGLAQNRRYLRGWRDFRIAQCSANATMRRCRKFGRLVTIAASGPIPTFAPRRGSFRLRMLESKDH